MQQAVSAMVAISQKAIMTQQPLFEEEPFAKLKMLNVVLLYTLLYIALLGRVFKIRNFFCTIFDPINVITH